MSAGTTSDASFSSAFLDEACGGDKDLRAGVDWVLRANGNDILPIADNPTSADKRSLPETDLPANSPQQAIGGRTSYRTGSRIGNYVVGDLLGAGGFGEVYLAERDYDGERRKVAIKLIRTQSGLSRSEIVRRFQQERKILARLGDHPNIARLIDGGQTEDGQPYLVMDYVEGDPIDEYCDAQKLLVADRLKLFRTVCAAVQFAHQNFIAHRDLKPSNILVTKDGTVKLLDFGIAKVLSSDSEGITQGMTRPGELLMTPEYASPEQVREEAITVRTDVYSLGVVLYRLLTGHLPYRFNNRSLVEIQRVVCSQPPVKPSEVISKPPADGEIELTPESVGENRGTRPEKLRKQLQADLDDIVLMALRKEPDRRYRSAVQFSEDIKRYLEDLPIIARPDMLSARTRRFVRQKKAAVLATLLVILGLGTGLGMALAAKRGLQSRKQ